MDIQKEKEKFEAWLIAEFKLKNHDYALHFVNGEYQRTPTQARWQAWQAAKAQAVPEGQILVNKGDYVELVRTNRERQKVIARLTEEVKILRDRKKYYKNKCKELSVPDDCVVVSKEPNDKVIKFIGGSKQEATIVYKAMLSAPQEPK